MKDFRIYEKTGGAIDLAMIKNPLGTSTRAKQAIMRNLDKLHLYAGENEKLLELISKQNNLKKKNVLITDGADGALTLIALAFFKGKKIVVPVPCFPRFEFYVKVGGGKPIFIPPKKDLNVDEEKVLSSKGEILLISSPNNPTGFSVSKDFIKRALGKFELVVLDETLMLSENGYENLLRKFGNLIITRSFSKLYGLAGMRIGYALAKEKLISKLRELSSPYPVSFLSQIAAMEAMRDRNFLKKTLEFIGGGRNFLFWEIRNENILRSEAISYILPISNLQKRRLRNRIAVTLSEGFRFLPKNFARISIGTHRENQTLVKFLGGG